MYVTTSWDDGHPLDLRLAEMLHKADLPATFYIPRSSQRDVLQEREIRRLSGAFEIGAHTLTHLDLNANSASKARDEIVQSKDWVEQVTGKECQMFCFPGGRFRKEHLEFATEAGYIGCRTVELLSLSLPVGRGIKVMSTTVQAMPHTAWAYVKNCLKRQRPERLARFHYFAPLLKGDWVALSRELLRTAAKDGGAFHLWGHSWEVEEHGQWQALCRTLEIMREYAGYAQKVTNCELCRVDPGRNMG